MHFWDWAMGESSQGGKSASGNDAKNDIGGGG